MPHALIQKIGEICQPKFDNLAAATSAASLLADNINMLLREKRLQSLLPKAVVEYRTQKEDDSTAYGTQVAGLLNNPPRKIEIGG